MKHYHLKTYVMTHHYDIISLWLIIITRIQYMYIQLDPKEDEASSENTESDTVADSEGKDETQSRGSITWFQKIKELLSDMACFTRPVTPLIQVTSTMLMQADQLSTLFRSRHRRRIIIHRCRRHRWWRRRHRQRPRRRGIFLFVIYQIFYSKRNIYKQTNKQKI